MWNASGKLLVLVGTAAALIVAIRFVTNDLSDASSSTLAPVSRIDRTASRESILVESMPAWRVESQAEAEAASGTESSAEQAVPAARDDSSEGRQLRGRVLAADGAPIASARVMVLRDRRRWAEDSRTLVSMADGRFEARMPDAGPFELHVSHPRWRATVLEDVAADPDLETLVVLEAGAEIVGEVVGPTGLPVEGANIVLVASRPEQLFDQERVTISDAQGQFRLSGLQGGLNRIRVEAEGFAISAENFDLHEGGTLEIRCDLAWSEMLTGQIVDDHGAPISDAMVSAIGSRHQSAVHADQDGHFLCDRIADEPLTVLVTAPGYAATTLKRVDVADSPLQIVLPSSQPATGFVRDARTGDPIPKARVLVSHGTQSWRTGSKIDGSFETSSLPPGEFVIEVSVRGYARFRREGQLLPSEVPLEIELSRGGVIVGRVLGPGRQPVEGVDVHARGAGSEPAPLPTGFSRRGSSKVLDSSSTDAEGRFELTGIPDGEVWVVAAHRELRAERAERVLVANGLAGPDLEIRMESGFTVQGRVLVGGEPATRGYVRILDEYEKTVRRLRLDAQGRYVARALASGTYRLVPEHTPEAVDPVTVVVTRDVEQDIGR